MKLTDRPGLLCFAGAAVLFLWAITRSIGDLPARIATHFGWDGTANGWSDKSAFRLTFLLLAAGISAFSILITWAVRFFPDSTINIPNRDHWLAAERRARTFSIISDLGFMIAGMTLLVLTQVYVDAIFANRLDPPVFRNTLGLLIFPALLFAGILFTYLRKFKAVS